MFRTLISTLLVVGARCTVDCGSGLTACRPPGVISDVTPKIGDPDFRALFSDIVRSLLPNIERAMARTDSQPICCVSSLSCLAMANLAIPFCYDKFTTNYFLPDGSFGTVVKGTYTSSNQDVANLESGDYKLVTGEEGNIYSGYESEKPDLANLPIPTQYTSAGVGSAIPASALGGRMTVTYTTTISGRTVSPSTVLASTLPNVVISLPIILTVTTTNTISNTVIVGTTVKNTFSSYTSMGTGIPGRTFPGTTIPPQTITLTTTEAVSQSTEFSSSSMVTASTSGSPKQNASIRQISPNMVLHLGIAIFSMGVISAGQY